MSHCILYMNEELKYEHIIDVHKTWSKQSKTLQATTKNPEMASWE